MDITIYWSWIDGKVVYSNKNPVEDVKDMIERFPSLTDKFARIAVYQLDTHVTVEDIASMLNGDFNHCMLKNFYRAVLLFEYNN